MNLEDYSKVSEGICGLIHNILYNDKYPDLKDSKMWDYKAYSCGKKHYRFNMAVASSILFYEMMDYINKNLELKKQE